MGHLYNYSSRIHSSSGGRRLAGLQGQPGLCNEFSSRRVGAKSTLFLWVRKATRAFEMLQWDKVLATKPDDRAWDPHSGERDLTSVSCLLTSVWVNPPHTK